MQVLKDTKKKLLNHSEQKPLKWLIGAAVANSHLHKLFSQINKTCPTFTLNANYIVMHRIYIYVNARDRLKEYLQIVIGWLYFIAHLMHDGEQVRRNFVDCITIRKTSW